MVRVDQALHVAQLSLASTCWNVQGFGATGKELLFTTPVYRWDVPPPVAETSRNEL